VNVRVSDSVLELRIAHSVLGLGLEIFCSVLGDQILYILKNFKLFFRYGTKSLVLNSQTLYQFILLFKKSLYEQNG
jgi:hypothetical protein